MDKKILALISVFVIAFILFVSIVAFNEPLRKFTSAKEEFAPSTSSSLVFAWPITAKRGSAVKVDVFVRSQTGKPLPDKPVTVTTSLGAFAQPTTKTDKSGKASFQLSSPVVGTAEIIAVVDNTLTLDKRLTVQFEP